MTPFPSFFAGAFALALSGAALASPLPIALTADGFGSSTGTMAGSTSGDSFSFIAQANDALDLLSLTSTYAMRSTRPSTLVAFSTPVQTTGFHITDIRFDGLSVGSNSPGVGTTTLSNANRTRLVNNFDNWEFSVSNLSAGSHTIQVFGSSAAGGGFTGTLVTTPVPEPETVALMLAGLGALGFIARRRRPD